MESFGAERIGMVFLLRSPGTGLIKYLIIFSHGSIAWTISMPGSHLTNQLFQRVVSLYRDGGSGFSGRLLVFTGSPWQARFCLSLRVCLDLATHLLLRRR